MGQPGCPQDACHLPDFDSDEDAEAFFASLKPKPQEPPMSFPTPGVDPRRRLEDDPRPSRPVAT